jgi:hypothetical protein
MTEAWVMLIDQQARVMTACCTLEPDCNNSIIVSIAAGPWQSYLAATLIR